MWVNGLTFLIVVGLLIYHLIRLGRIWWSTHRVNVFSSLFIVLQITLLVALFTEHQWVLWISGALLLLLLAWKLNPLGGILDQCEEIASIAGFSYREMKNFRAKQNYLTARYEAGRERKRQLEEDETAFWEAFRSKARPRSIETTAWIETAISLPSREGTMISVGPGNVPIEFSGWRVIEDRGEWHFEIEIDLVISDANGRRWRSTFSTEIENLVELGLSSQPRRTPDQLIAWTEIDSENERVIREHCLFSKALYRADFRDLFEVTIGRNHYLILTKHAGGFIDLAWDSEEHRFLLRLAGLQARERNGRDAYDLDVESEQEGPQVSPWSSEQIEPVVFPVLPEELLPFGKAALFSPFRLQDEGSGPGYWPPVFEPIEDRG